MLDPGTLRGRLTLTYASALVIALVLFAALALTVLDRAQRSALDVQLATSERAVHAIVLDDHGHIAMDERDRIQLRSILGGRANGGVWQADGTSVAQSGTLPPATLARAALDVTAPAFLTLDGAQETLRVLVSPVFRRRAADRGNRRVARDRSDCSVRSYRSSRVRADDSDLGRHCHHLWERDRA